MFGLFYKFQICFLLQYPFVLLFNLINKFPRLVFILYTMPTVMKDEDLLKKALDQNGCKTIELGTTNVEAIMEDSAVTFHLTEEGTFKAL